MRQPRSPEPGRAEAVPGCHAGRVQAGTSLALSIFAFVVFPLLRTSADYPTEAARMVEKPTRLVSRRPGATPLCCVLQLQATPFKRRP